MSRELEFWDVEGKVDTVVMVAPQLTSEVEVGFDLFFLTLLRSIDAKSGSKNILIIVSYLMS